MNRTEDVMFDARTTSIRAGTSIIDQLLWRKQTRLLFSSWF